MVEKPISLVYTPLLMALTGVPLPLILASKLNDQCWLNLNTFKHDRWALTNNFRVDYSKNKTIDSAEYYNPSKATSLEFGADLSYYQPLNYGLVLNHHLKASVGAYKQAELSREKMWSISYGHQWRVGKKFGVSYEIGRKKNIYDGNAEFNNFGNLNFSIYY